MSFILVQVLNGLSHAAALFVVAAGLTLVFGVTRIPNFAHGSFAMIGAYLAATLVLHANDVDWPAWTYYAALGAAALGVGLLGWLMNALVLRPLARAPELFQLLATFGVVLIAQDLTLRIWGPEEIFAPRAPGLSGTVDVFGEPYPVWHFAMIVAMPVVWAALALGLKRTRWGVLVRAATQDREMCAALGIDERRLFGTVLFVGAALAGLGGALQLPTTTIHPQMDLPLVVEAFVVVVIGGMGSVTGALVASVLIGLLHAFGIWLVPQATLALMFVAMAAVLVLRPAGLFGRAVHASDVALVRTSRAVRTTRRRDLALAVLAVLVLAVWPLFMGPYAQLVLTEMLILALFALSLQLMIGQGGLASFGQAAFFGLGAYGAALAVHGLDASMGSGLAAGVLCATLGAAAFGAIALRSSGVYFAMLTLAFAQILWSTAVQWVGVTGGDNGLLGVRPAASLTGRLAFYEFVLAVFVGCVVLAWRFSRSPFGMRVRALRDHATRAESIGINAFATRFGVVLAAGALAGISGALSAYQRGSVFPNALSIATSVDALVMVLLGGIASLWGAIGGAFVYHGLATELSRSFDAWRLLLGLTIVGLAIAWPSGLAGAIAALIARVRSVDSIHRR